MYIYMCPTNADSLLRYYQQHSKGTIDDKVTGQFLQLSVFTLVGAAVWPYGFLNFGKQQVEGIVPNFWRSRLKAFKMSSIIA